MLARAPVPGLFRGMSEPRLIDLVTGRATPVSLTHDRSKAAGVVAICGGERLVMAELAGPRRLPAAGPPAPPDEGDALPEDVSATEWKLSVYEVAQQRSNPRSVVVDWYRAPGPEEMVFFPGGRHVLWGGHVLDLEKGTLRSVEFVGERPGPYLTVRNSAFIFGHRHRWAQDSDPQSTWKAVWETDPETGPAKRIAILPEDSELISADGDRWLLGCNIGDECEPKLPLEIHDHRTGSSVPVWGAPEEASFHALVEGRP